MKREIIIFFSDLQGFTTISQGLEPEELTALLNEYLTTMSKIIMKEGGTIDKFEGDAIIAFWNAPLDPENHAVRGIRAALDSARSMGAEFPARELARVKVVGKSEPIIVFEPPTLETQDAGG